MPPTISCSAPFGSTFASSMMRTAASVRYAVALAGFTIAGMPARKVGASFSNMPQTGKLNALMWIATPCSEV